MIALPPVRAVRVLALRTDWWMGQAFAKLVDMHAWIVIFPMRGRKTACEAGVEEENFREINRTVTGQEYTDAITFARKAGLYRFDEG